MARPKVKAISTGRYVGKVEILSFTLIKFVLHINDRHCKFYVPKGAWQAELNVTFFVGKGQWCTARPNPNPCICHSDVMETSNTGQGDIEEISPVDTV